MAKYILNYTKAGARTVNCAVLDENCLSDTYTVQFDNGVIKNVDKRRVKSLDHIDEAVLDRIRKFFRRLWDNIVKAGKYIYVSIKNTIVPVNSPINTMIAAKEIDGLTFIPSNSLADLAEEQGIDAQEIIDESPEDEEFLKDANNFWKKVMKAFQKDGEEGANQVIAQVAESNKYVFIPERKLYEASRAAKDIDLKSATWENVGTVDLIKKLGDQFEKYQAGAALNPDEVPVPYCIWGAPGIGKSQIIKKMIRSFRKTGTPANIISINAMAMRKDDWALPGMGEVVKSITNKDKDGKDVTVRFTANTARELPKSWLPAYDPEWLKKDENLTLEALDDVANGGDGTGTGVGGFFFIDELSRIAPDVNNVIMTLLQSREFNGLILGSKWMFVAAANRASDMGDNASTFHWDAAQTGRFSHLNFVPTFAEWIEWAESPIEGTNRPHILPEIVAFLKENQNCWYNASMVNDSDDKVAKTMYPNARGWENASKEAYGTIDARNIRANNPDSATAKLFKELGIEDDPADLTPEEIVNILKHNVGNKAAGLYKTFAGFDNLFKPEIAREVWIKGDKVDVPFRPNNVTIQSAIEKIFANHPNYSKRVSYNGGTRVPLTSQEMVNVIKYIIKCVDKVDERDGSVKDNILNAISKQIDNILLGPDYRLDLFNPTSKDSMMMVPAKELLEDRLGITLDVLAGQD